MLLLRQSYHRSAISCYANEKQQHPYGCCCFLEIYLAKKENICYTYDNLSTVAVTGGMGDVTNTFAYDAYGRLTEKVGMDDILFCYNGKYGVITEPSGLVYMRARYYSPELRRFINADVVAGEISNAITLNRYAYANGNPISNVDPLGLTAERGDTNWYGAATYEKITVTTIDDEIDLSLGLDILLISHTQTVTATKTHGTTGEWFGAYAYTDINIGEQDVVAGAGLDLLYALGFDVYVKWLGIGATLSLNLKNSSVYANVEIDLVGDTTASVGIVNKSEDGKEINDQYAIKGNTWLVIWAVGSLLGFQLDPKNAPKFAPQPG